jgi:predicted nucleic acid-binding Zn ribbon protein
MSRREKIQKAAQRTAGEARQAAKRQRDSERQARARRDFATADHRHCSVCWAPIPLDTEPPVCSDAVCAEKQQKREASRKRLTVMLYLFPGIAILLVLLQVMGASG